MTRIVARSMSSAGDIYLALRDFGALMIEKNVRLSGLTARLSEAHTQDATSWITTVEDGGRSYNVVFLTQSTVASDRCRAIGWG